MVTSATKLKVLLRAPQKKNYDKPSCCSLAKWCLTLQSHGQQYARLLCPVSWSLLKLMSIESVMPSNHLILCWPLLLLPQSFPASGSFPICLLFEWLRYWSFSISPSNEFSGLTSFRIDLQSKGLSTVYFSTTVLKHQFFGAQPSLWSRRHVHT